ncbi:hypothetical protein CLM85_00960 [Streptomyces albidoflavus]|nr:hypothetical protein CLM85_00960 [Streptomyces albidoflavus]
MYTRPVLFFTLPDPIAAYRAFSEIKAVPEVTRAAIVERSTDGVPLVQWSVCVCSGVCRRPAPDQGAGRRQRVICGGGCRYCR